MIQPQLTPQQKWQMFKDKGRVVYVDFDGTLCRFAYPALGPPLPGARKFMRELKKRGYRAVILTSRMSAEVYTPEEREESATLVGDWCRKHGVPFDGIDDGNSGKPIGLAYVDDRGVAFHGNYDRCLRRIEAIREREEARFEGDDDG